MNKIITLLYFLLIVNLFILGNSLINFFTHDDILPVIYAKDSLHSNDNYNLILKILKDSKKSDLIHYIDYIELNIIEEIPNDTTNKIAFILSLPDQNSFIALYKKESDDNLKFDSIVDDLSCIKNFYFYENLLAVEQIDTDSSNNITKREFLNVFYQKNNEFSLVFEKNLYKEEIIQTEDSLYKKTETSSVDFVNNSIPRILCISTTTTFKPNLNEDYEEISKNISKEIFELDIQKNKFILYQSKSLNR